MSNDHSLLKSSFTAKDMRTIFTMYYSESKINFMNFGNVGDIYSEHCEKSNLEVKS
jgi:hypothetical protein